MVIILISWILISFLFLSFGSILVFAYNKASAREESYGVMDTLLLGMCGIMLVMGINSLFLPSNQYLLLAFCLASIGYWIARRNYLKTIFKRFQQDLGSLSTLQISAIGLILLGLASYAMWSSNIFDAAYYHHQFIRWCEEYAVVPGLANMESRFGFNSNYLLLNAIFNLRFILGEPVYLIQSLISAYIVVWILSYIIKSKYAVRGFFLLLLYALFISFNMHNLHDSSTDIIPTMLVFYLVARYVLNPDSLLKNYLLAIFLPITLATFKLSIVPFTILSLYVLYYIIKRKEYRVLWTLVTLCLLVCVPWLIRNVIISGYLVYPLHYIDLFDVEWKLPKLHAMIEVNSIEKYAKYMFWDVISFGFFQRVEGGIMRFKMWFINDVVTVSLYLISAITPFVMLYISRKKEQSKKLPASIYVVYISLLASIIYWALTAPDFRFISGAMFANLFLLVAVLRWSKPSKLLSPKWGNIALACFAILIALTGFKRTYNSYFTKNMWDAEKEGRRVWTSIWFKPYSAFAADPVEFYEVQKNGVTFYISENESGKKYDKLPSMGDNIKYPNIPQRANINILQMRGKSLQDGFVNSNHIKK